MGKETKALRAFGINLEIWRGACDKPLSVQATTGVKVGSEEEITAVGPNSMLVHFIVPLTDLVNLGKSIPSLCCSLENGDGDVRSPQGDCDK